MEYAFKLSDYPNDNFKINSSFWKGITSFTMNGKPLKTIKEKGKPFEIPKPNGDGFTKAYIKPSLPDFAPTLFIDGKKHLTAEKLKWYEYVIGGLPILLVFSGGFIGAIIGAPISLTNFQIIRTEEKPVLKYAKVIGLTAIAYAVFTFLILKIKSL